MVSWATESQGSLRIRVRVQPRASRSDVVGEHGDALKIRLAAPPVDGAANEELIRFLADRLDLPRSRVTLVSGATSRSKTLAVEGLSVAEATRRLALG